MKNEPINFMIITDDDKIRDKLRRWNRNGWDFPYHSTIARKNEFLELDGSFKLVIIFQKEWDYTILERFAMKSYKMNPDVWLIESINEPKLRADNLARMIFYWYQTKTRTGYYNKDFVNKKRHYNKNYIV